MNRTSPEKAATIMTKRRAGRTGLTAVVLALGLAAMGCGRDTTAGRQDAANQPGPQAVAGERDERRPERTIVELSPEGMARAGIGVETVRGVSALQVLVAPAELQPNSDRVARVGPRVAGRIARVIAALGEQVKAGQPLATIRSPEAVELTAALESARATETLARRSLARERALFERRISAQREVLEAEATLTRAEAATRAAEARLASIGFDTQGINVLRGDPVVTLTSPIAGTIIERTAAADAPVGPDSVLFVIADLRALWLTVRVPETRVEAVRLGQIVSVQVEALLDRPVVGRVEYVSPVVTPDTRTVDVRVQVPNRAGALRPGMSANARFDLPDADRSAGDVRMLVPRTAVQELNGASVVFVPVGERRFEARPVTLGATYGGAVEIVSGTKVGDRIVVRGAFTLKAQSVRGSRAEDQ